MSHWKEITTVLFLAIAIGAGLSRPASVSADQSTTEPGTPPSPEAIAHAADMFSSAYNDLDSGKSEQALIEFRAASDLYRKAQGTQETAEGAACLNGEGLCLDQLGRDADALPIYKAALEICRRVHHDQDDPDVATALVNVACCLGNLGRSDEALPIGRTALEMRRRLSQGKDSPDVASSMDTVARCLVNLSRDNDAIPVYQASLAMKRRIHNGEDDAEVATSLVNLASCLDDLGREADALTNFRLALEMKKRLCKGQDDPDVATTENSVAFCLFSLGRYGEALPIFQDTLEMRRRIYRGEDNVEVVSSLNNVGKCLDSLGRGAEALPVYQSALEMTRRMCKNSDSADLAVVMDNVAACMESLGRASEALLMFQQALEMRERIYKGQDDTDVASSLNDLATCLECLGRNQEALNKFRSAHDMLERLHKGQDSADVATALANVAECLDTLGRSAEALPDHEAALEMRRRIYGNLDHPDIADSLNNLAGCFTLLGRHRDALSAQQAALEMWQRVYKNIDHPDVATALSNVGLSLDNLSRSAEALPMYQLALEMRRRLYGNQDHPAVAINLGLIAGCLMSLDRPAEALPNCRAALEMQQRIYKGRDHPIVAWNMAKVATCLSALGRKEEALPLFQAAVAMSERLSNPELYRYSANLADCLLSMGRLAEADAAYETSINAFEQVRAALGGDDQDRMKFMDAQDDCDAFVAMVRVQLKLNRPDKAAEYLDRGRGRSLLDVLERAELQSGKDLLSPIEARAQQAHDVQLLSRIQQAGNALSDADEQVQQLTSQINFARALDGPDGNSQIAELQPKLDDACRQYAAAHRQAFNLAGTTTFTDAASATKIQSLLKPRQHLLMYSITDRDAVVILIPPPGQAITGMVLTEPDEHLTLSGVALERLIVDYQQSVIRHGQDFTRGVRLVADASTTRPKDDMAQEGYDLFCRLMPPAIWREIKDDDLVYVIPDAGMNGLPLETLIVQKPPSPNAKDCSYWLDQGPAICYGPSASALIKLCARKADGAPRKFAHQAVLLGDPVLQRDAGESPAPATPAVSQTRNASLGAYGRLTPLPGTRKEVTGIYQVLAGRPYTNQDNDSIVVLMGEDATSQHLAAAAAGTRYLHLATHGLARSGKDALYSSIVLTQPRVITSRDTGLLTLQDLFDHWGGKLDGTELVVLSACDSQGIDEGKGNAVTDEGVYGLPWGFWYAGAPTVVASLWEVQDDSTAKLMETFYRELQSPSANSKLVAFTTARKKLKQQYPEPFFWAPFIYLGDPN